MAFYQYQISRSDLGLASMFARAVKGDVVVVDAKKGDCFIWNEKSALWDERPGIFCQNMIGYSLNPIFDAMLEFPL